MRKLATALLLVLISVALLPSLAISSGLAGFPGALVARYAIPPAPQTPVPEALLDQSRRLIRASPLYARAYLAEGLAFDKQGRRAAAEALISWSTLLDPRVFEARLWLGLRYFETGRVAAALDQLETLYTLAPQYAAQTSLILASAARVTAARRMIAGWFGGQPVIIDIAVQAQQAGMPANEMLELLAGTRLPALPNGVSTAQRLVIGRSLADGDLLQAHALWRSLLPQKPRNPVFDGDFGGQDAAPPFRWTFAEGAAMTARRVDITLPGHSTAAELRSSSVVPEKMAEQTIVLSPGGYGLRAIVRSDAPANRASGFSWLVKCSRTGEEIAQLPIGGTAGRWAARDWPFTVASTCPVLLLQIASEAIAPDQGENVLNVTGTEVRPNRT